MARLTKAQRRLLRQALDRRIPEYRRLRAFSTLMHLTEASEEVIDRLDRYTRMKYRIVRRLHRQLHKGEQDYGREAV